MPIDTFQWVTINTFQFLAKVDTGAYSSSIDSSLVEKLGLKYTEEKKVVVSALGAQERRVLEPVAVSWMWDEVRTEILVSFSASDRSGLKYPVLLGRKDLVGEYVCILEYKPKGSTNEENS